MADTKAPAPVVIMVALMVPPMASLGWYGLSSLVSDMVTVRAVLSEGFEMDVGGLVTAIDGF